MRRAAKVTGVRRRENLRLGSDQRDPNPLLARQCSGDWAVLWIRYLRVGRVSSRETQWKTDAGARPMGGPFATRWGLFPRVLPKRISGRQRL